jgi:NarL family two-component system response regulator LiaR
VAKTILVVDDNPIIRRLICQLLDLGKDYNIYEEATNGQEGIELAQRYHPDLIILDLSMPTLNGLDAAKELKKIMPEVPIILFTQFPDLGRHLPRTDLPVDRIISKSDSHALVKQIRSMLPV